ncbi:MAG: rRNA maturation RNase YbeY [Patescibacteria group bacterium]|nr:rRNA maturation RNase YbeY [Patescibacteria group bacterium]
MSAKKTSVRVFFDSPCLKNACPEIDVRRIWRKTSSLIRKSGFPQNINLVFVDNSAIKKLNRRYRGKNYPTDVLSFNYSEKKCEKNHGSSFWDTGEIYLGLPYLQTISRKENIPLDRLIEKTIIHGLIHLAGYDHKRANDKKIMQTLEKKCQKMLNYKRRVTS